MHKGTNQSNIQTNKNDNIEKNSQLNIHNHIVTINQNWYHPLQAFPKLHDVNPKIRKPVIQTRTHSISHFPSRPPHSWSSNASYAPNNSSNNLR